MLLVLLEIKYIIERYRKMKKWDLETLTELYIFRGYSKKTAAAMAKNYLKELTREKTDLEKYQAAQEMQYN